MKNFNETCCTKKSSGLLDVYVTNDDVQLNYNMVARMANIICTIAKNAVSNYRTDGYYGIARAAWELENNGKVQIFARENGIDFSWDYDWFMARGYTSALECALDSLGCDLEIIINKDEKRITADIYVHSDNDYLNDFNLNDVENGLVSDLNALIDNVTYHLYDS